MKPQYPRANIRINADEIYEIKHWAKQLGVTVQQLRSAIEQVGPLVNAVCLHLKAEMHPDNPWYPRAEWPIFVAPIIRGLLVRPAQSRSRYQRSTYPKLGQILKVAIRPRP
jgi:hypothetical protein